MFGWNKKVKHIKSCNVNHFMYVVSLCMNKIIKPLVNKEKILIFLDSIKFNGLLFSLINCDIFTRSIEKLFESNNNYKQFGIKLYEKIKKYNLKSIKPASLCNIIFTEFTKV